MPACCDCKKDLPRLSFAKSQLKKDSSHRRCHDCVTRQLHDSTDSLITKIDSNSIAAVVERADDASSLNSNNNIDIVVDGIRQDESLTLYAGPCLQQQIDTLPNRKNPPVKFLTIASMTPDVRNDSNPVSFHVSVPALEHLTVKDVNFKEITLSETSTPSLKHLTIQNIAPDCNVYIDVPTLQHVKILNLKSTRPPSNHERKAEDDDNNNNNNSSWIVNMLEWATNLVSFHSMYANATFLPFYSNALESITIQYAGPLDALIIYAPNLKTLTLEHCYVLDRILFLDSYKDVPDPPLDQQEQEDRVKENKFKVNLVNVNLSADAEIALRCCRRASLGMRYWS